MNDTERLRCETEMLPKLKRHLNSVLSLRPIKRLSPLSVSILKNAKGFTDEIGAWAGSLTRWEGADERFKELLASMKVNCTAEEGEVIETALESFEWVYDNLKCYPFSVCKSLNGDEVFWAWDFLMMSDEQIKHGDDSDGEKRLGRRRVVLKRFADLGIDILGLGEKRKTESGGNSPPVSKTNDTDDLIDLIEEAEAFLEDLNLGHYTDLQIKLSKTRYRLLKERETGK